MQRLVRQMAWSVALTSGLCGIPGSRLLIDVIYSD